MQIVKMHPKIVSQKLIAHVNPELAKVYHLPEGHQSMAFFTTDNDDIGYLAADDATKKANIKVIHAKTFYGGLKCSWSTYAGSLFLLFSGPRVEDVRSGLRYVNEFVENQSGFCNFDGDEGTAFYALTIPRVGKFFSEWCGIEQGLAYTYLIGGPIEANYALDKALKAGDTRVAKYWYPPSNANSSGAILCGSESACRAAANAFVDALQYAIQNPLDF